MSRCKVCAGTVSWSTSLYAKEASHFVFALTPLLLIGLQEFDKFLENGARIAHHLHDVAHGLASPTLERQAIQRWKDVSVMVLRQESDFVRPMMQNPAVVNGAHSLALDLVLEAESL